MIFVQTAGTNGKGSVCTMLAEILMRAGYRTGLFTSPHLISKEERIRVNGEPIPKDAFDALLNKHGSNADMGSFFAACTAACVEWFESQSVDIAVMETGLGGRLDPVTALGARLIAITRIGLDHTELLGSTIELIAQEKCAVIREGAVVVTCAQRPEAEKVIRRTCAEKGARLIVVGPSAEAGETAGLMAAAMARELGISQSIIDEALEQCVMPARLQYFLEHDTLIDGGHNADAIEELWRTLDTEYSARQKVFLAAMMRDKAVDALADAVQSGAAVFTTTVDGGRAFTPEELAERIGCGTPLMLPEAFYAAKKAAGDRGALLVVCGSFYLAGEVLSILGVSL